MNSWFTTDYYSDPKNCAKMNSKGPSHRHKKRGQQSEIMGKSE